MAGSFTSSSAVVVNKDGLAAGTYYVKVNTFYDGEWVPYTLEDSLFLPEQPNDTEPNNTKAQALVLPLNGTVTGHTNYYYNLQKDGEDWYSITTTSDGMISLNLQSNNGQNVWAYLYDNDGVTLLNSQYTTSSITINTDGLQSGTYFIKINTFYSYEWAPYTLSNTLITYNYGTDTEPVNFFGKSATIPANGTVTGHVNFYYNGTKDATDFWKINYTGGGTMSLNFNMENHKIDNSLKCTYLQIFKDTLVAPIYNSYFCGSPNPINLSGLTNGYYYLKVFTYYANDFTAYSIGATFTQINKAAIKLITADTSALCDSTNKISFKCTGSSSPYRVQLYHFNLPYGAPLIVNNSRNFIYKNLPHGNYYAIAYGDGSTGTAFRKSPTVQFIPTPSNNSTTNIKATAATANWTALSCASFYRILYRKTTDTIWRTSVTNGNTSFRALTGLDPATNYIWIVAAADSLNNITGLGAYSQENSFTTLPAGPIARFSNEMENEIKSGSNDLSVYPNPAKSFFTMQFKTKQPNTNVNVTLRDVNGKIVWIINTKSASLNGMKVNTEKLATGVYMLQIIGTDGFLQNKKVVITK